jgi:hypothetical protein
VSPCLHAAGDDWDGHGNGNGMAHGWHDRTRTHAFARVAHAPAPITISLQKRRGFQPFYFYLRRFLLSEFEIEFTPFALITMMSVRCGRS